MNILSVFAAMIMMIIWLVVDIIRIALMIAMLVIMVLVWIIRKLVLGFAPKDANGIPNDWITALTITINTVTSGARNEVGFEVAQLKKQLESKNKEIKNLNKQVNAANREKQAFISMMQATEQGRGAISYTMKLLGQAKSGNNKNV